MGMLRSYLEQVRHHEAGAALALFASDTGDDPQVIEIEPELIEVMDSMWDGPTPHHINDAEGH